MGDRAGRLRAVLGVGSAVAAVGAPFLPTPVVSVPVGDVVAPALALGVIRRILRKRAEQVELRQRPRRLTDGEVQVLAGVIRSSEAASVPVEVGEGTPLPGPVMGLLSSVSAAEQSRTDGPIGDWSIVVRLLGEPVVESKSGQQAVFGKRRSMELLAWMVLNRDRLTRSAARNAMWDVQIADSTFGTILSDLRRGLSRLAPPPSPEGWCPATFTDRLVLPGAVVSDLQLMDQAVLGRKPEELVHELSRVRDVPFAGTAYQWADLDGSTTRAVISVLDAVDMLVQLAGECSDQKMALVALRAGLRVMPGDESLLELQRALIRRG